METSLEELKIQLGVLQKSFEKFNKFEVLQTSFEESAKKNSEVQSKFETSLEELAKKYSELQISSSELVKKNSDLQTKLDVMQTSLEECVQKNESEALNIRLGRLEDQQDDVQKSIAVQLGVQKNLEKEQKSLLETFTNVIPKNIEARLVKMEDKQMAVQTTLESQQVELQEAFFRSYQMTPDFVRIGQRYFYVENNVKADWTTANSICRKMGGYLAAFQNQSEVDAIFGKLKAYYWLGINDRDSENNFVSVATGKPVKFKNWRKGQPDNHENNEDCVHINGSSHEYAKQFNDLSCDRKLHFICQFDKEV
nr:C-type lectin domain family 4 member F-like [Drosophila takahashii]